LVGRDNVIERALSGDGLDASHPRGNATLAEDPEEPDVARPRDVRAAAELGRVVAEPEDADVLVVLLAEERHRAGSDRVVEIHHARFRRRVGADLALTWRSISRSSSGVSGA
jgi:hypothetical protein